MSSVIGNNGHVGLDVTGKPPKVHKQTGRSRVHHSTKSEQDVDDPLFKMDEEKVLIEN